ncbi:MAG: efflux RND transporter permease subunit [Gemmataceae bacterium]|nr:efflux RND transporter permease subunit [Gemmataceae bacterium]
MLTRLVHTSLRFRVAIVAIAVAVLVAGINDIVRAPWDVFPEFAPPLVEVQVEAPGMSSEAVENLVTVPLESALNGVPRMTTLRSRSVQGLSSVQLLFERGTDIFQSRQIVSERVAVAAARLPQQAKAPHVLPPLSSTSRALHIGLKPKRPDKLVAGEPVLTQTDVSVLMKWVIEPRLLAVPGVANISTYGLQPKQFQVLVKPGELRDFGVTLEQVKQAARQATLYASAGFHDTPNQRLAIQYASRVESASDLGKTVVAHHQGQAILLEHVSEITTGNPPYIGEGVINNDPGLFVVVEKYPWANTLDVTLKTEEALEALRPSLAGVDVTTGIFRPASFIELALSNLRTAMLLGAGIVALILVAFLFEWRTALISMTAIPLSIVAALWILARFGATINTMVLAGLAIALGEVVDDAIIDVENIVRRLRQNRLADQPLSAFQVVLRASLEVRSAVVFASFIVVLVCLPIFFLSGVAGAFFQPLAVAYILAIMASLVVALTITPALSLLLLPKAVERQREAPLTRGLRWLYRRGLPALLRWPILTFALVIVLLGAAGWLFAQLKEEYLPRFRESDFLMHWIAKPGTSIDAMRRDIEIVSKEMLAETAVLEFGSHIARAEAGEEVVGPNFAELWISIGAKVENYDAERRKIEAVMARHPGFEHDLLTYLQERIKEVLSGAGASIVLRTYGHDLAGLRRKAEEIRQAIEGERTGEGRVPDVVDLRVEPQVLVPQLEVILHPHRLAAFGLSPGAVLEQMITLVNGVKVGEVLQDQRSFDLVVWGHPDVRKSLPDLRRLEIALPNPGPGKLGTVPLEALGEIRQVNAPNTIRHDRASRCIDVTCNVRGGDLGGVVREIRRRVEPLQSTDFRIEFLGEYQARSENQRQLLLVSAFSLLGVALLLYMDFRSFRLTLLVMLTLPFALIGGVAAVYWTGGVLSLGSLIGFVTVIGIAARNGIMLVSHYRHLEVHEKTPFGRELILRGAEERLSPILMTALAAGLGLLPIALAGLRPGLEVEHPMAVVILGGLFTSTLLNLLVLPVLYECFGRGAAQPDEETG